jgi:hypothetical protein
MMHMLTPEAQSYDWLPASGAQGVNLPSPTAAPGADEGKTQWTKLGY